MSRLQTVLVTCDLAVSPVGPCSFSPLVFIGVQKHRRVRAAA